MQKSSPSQVFIGAAIIFLGAGFLLDALNIWSFGSVMRDWWPAIIITIGLLSLLSNPSIPVWPLFIIGVGSLLLANNLNIISINVWQIVWPVAVIIMGVSFFMHWQDPKPKVTTADASNFFVAFSGINSICKSAHYVGGKISAMFGGVNLDLRQAEITDLANLNIFTAFGGVDVKVPKNWTVHIKGLPIFGGWEDKTKHPASSSHAPVLEIRGTWLFGGMTVKN